MKLIRQILAVCMALVMLVSTTGFVMSAHYCEGQLQNFSFSNMSASCEMHAAKLPPCHHDQQGGAAEEHHSCCEDQTFVNDGQESTIFSFSLKVIKADLSFVAVIVRYMLAEVYAGTSLLSNFIHYSPPLFERNIPVFVQSFLW